MTTGESQISDADRDSLFAMPLCIVPLETQALATARVIKNARLESVLEIFSGDKTGSGQLAVESLPGEFGWDQGAKHPDMATIKKLASLQSYDVYSLRIALRQLGISLEDIDALRLSEEKEKDLTRYMTMFTHPLIREVYGDSASADIQSFDDILKLFRDPDVKKALTRLKKMAEKLDVAPDSIPSFLEDYGDIFLSLSYYRQCLDRLEPAITMFLDSIRNLRVSGQLRNDRGFQDVTREMEAVLNEAMTGLTGRFEAFDRASNGMWHDISADRFREVEKLIRRFHLTNGGVLCALWVKMTAWTRAFPKGDVGAPAKRAEFIQTELKHGLDKIRKLERSAPQIRGF